MKWSATLAADLKLTHCRRMPSTPPIRARAVLSVPARQPFTGEDQAFPHDPGDRELEAAFRAEGRRDLLRPPCAELGDEPGPDPDRQRDVGGGVDDLDVVEQRPQVVFLVHAAFRSRPRQRPCGEQTGGRGGEVRAIDTVRDARIDLDAPVRGHDPAWERRRTEPDVLGPEEGMAAGQPALEALADAPGGHPLREEDLGELRLADGGALEWRAECDSRPAARVELGERQAALLEGRLPRLDRCTADEIGRYCVATEREPPTLARFR